MGVHQKFVKARDHSHKGEDLTSVALDVIEQNHKYYKYLCPRCTGVAYYTNCIEIDHPQEGCNDCKLPLPPEVDETRFIELTEEGASDAGLIQP